MSSNQLLFDLFLFTLQLEIPETSIDTVQHSCVDQDSSEESCNKFVSRKRNKRKKDRKKRKHKTSKRSNKTWNGDSKVKE